MAFLRLLIFATAFLIYPLSAQAQSVGDKCPDISYGRKITLQLPANKQDASDEGVALNIPTAYISKDPADKAKLADENSTLALSADFQSLAPACLKWPKPDMDGEDKLGVFLFRVAKPAAAIEMEKSHASDAKEWQRLSFDEAEYDHYFTPRARYFTKHLLIPKGDMLGVPFLILCDTPRELNQPMVLGTCQLWTNYKGAFLVETHFSSGHLVDLKSVYQKTNSLLDRFMAN